MKKLLTIGVSIALLSACSLDNVNRDKKIAYKSSSSTKPLSFPPDLSSDRVESLYTVPNTLSGYKKSQNSAPASASNILPQYNDVRMVRSGNQRWLVTKTSPAVLWPKLKQFWQSLGIPIKQENPSAGIIETEWAENRAELNTGFIRGFLSKKAGFLYSTGTQDKFKMRLERSPTGQTEIFLSHQRMEEKLNGSSVIWKPAKPMPELEAEILSRLMVQLGASKQNVAQASVSAPAQSYARAKLTVTKSGGSFITLHSDFANAWRNTGNALQRTGFTVKDLNRAAGIYYVDYSDPEYRKKKGFFKIFKSNKPQQTKYIIKVASISGGAAQVSVLDRNQQLLKDQSAQRITKILYQQLK